MKIKTRQSKFLLLLSLFSFFLLIIPHITEAATSPALLPAATGFSSSTLNATFDLRLYAVTGWQPGFYLDDPTAGVYFVGSTPGGIYPNNIFYTGFSYGGYIEDLGTGYYYGINIPTSNVVAITCTTNVSAWYTVTGPGTFYTQSNCVGSYVFTLVQPAPTLTSVSTSTSSPTIEVVHGTGFASTGNTVQILNSASTTLATIPDFTSSNGTITFTIPPSLTVGTYSVEVSAGNGYSNALTFKVPGPVITSLYSIDGDLINLKGTAFNAGYTGGWMSYSSVNIYNTSMNLIGTSTSNVFAAWYGQSSGTIAPFYAPASMVPGTYYIEINGMGEAYSAPFEITIPSLIPSNLTDTFSTLQVGATTTAQVILNWTVPAGSSTVGLKDFSIKNNASSSSFTMIGTSTLPTYIDSNGGNYKAIPSYVIRVEYTDGTYSPYYNFPIISNCISMGGSGPDSIVFAEGTSSKFTNSDLLTEANNAISNGFDSIDPYKTNIKYFSFYVDLNSYNDSLWPISVENGTSFFSSYVGTEIIQPGSSCHVNNIKDYILFFNNPTLYWAWSSSLAGFTYYNVAPSVAGPNEIGYQNNVWTSLSLQAIRAGVIIHETGHAIAGLFDEYILNTTGSIVDDLYNGESITENCTSNPSLDYRSPFNNLMYGSYLDKGCSYLLNSASVSKGANVSAYYRPAVDSIMSSGGSGNISASSIDPIPQFNIISCGYVMAAINNVSPLKNNAAFYWPQCYTMAQKGTVTGLSEIPVQTTPPAVSSISVNGSNSTSLYSGDPTITGSNFSTVSTNDVHLVNTSSSSEMYDITAPASPDGTHLSFMMPTGTSSIPLGTYTLEVGGFNSLYSSPMTVTVVAPPVSLVTSNITATSTVLTWSSSIGSTVSYSLMETTPSTTAVVSSSTVKTYSLTKLVPGTNYCYTLTATAASSSVVDSNCFTTLNITIATSTLTATSTISSSATFTWSPLSNVSSYTLLETSPASTTLFTTATGTSYILKGLTPKTTYCALLLATNVTNGVVTQSQSSPACATTPSNPAYLTATSTTASSTIFTWSSSFTAPSYTLIETTPVHYELYQGTTTSFVFTSLTPATQYCAVLTATSGSNAASSSDCVTTLAAPPILTINGNQQYNMTFNWSDADPAITSYTLFGTIPTSWNTGALSSTTTSYTMGVSSGTTYCALVVAFNSSGISATSTQVCSTTSGSVSGGAPAVPLPISGSSTNPGSGGDAPSGGSDQTPAYNYLPSITASVWNAIVGWGESL